MKLLSKIKVALANRKAFRQIRKAEKEIKENPGIDDEAMALIKQFSEIANKIDQETKEFIKNSINQNRQNGNTK